MPIAATVDGKSFIRRSHDMGRPAWFAVLGFVPIVSLYFLCKKGTAGPNLYGPDPLRRSP